MLKPISPHLNCPNPPGQCSPAQQCYWWRRRRWWCNKIHYPSLHPKKSKQQKTQMNLTSAPLPSSLAQLLHYSSLHPKKSKQQKTQMNLTSAPLSSSLAQYPDANHTISQLSCKTIYTTHMLKLFSLRFHQKVQFFFEVSGEIATVVNLHEKISLWKKLAGTRKLLIGTKAIRAPCFWLVLAKMFPLKSCQVVNINNEVLHQHHSPSLLQSKIYYSHAKAILTAFSPKSSTFL